MTQKIHTIQSSDKKEFDKKVNDLLEIGGELMDGGYQVINNDDGVVYSQVIVMNKDYLIQYYANGEKYQRKTYKDGKEDGLSTNWWYEIGQKHSECIWKDGDLISEKYFNEDGSVKE